MTWTAPEIDRTFPPGTGDERRMLRGYVDFHRHTLLWKCRGQEYARHNGHADLLRERIDGAVGQ